MEDTIEVEGSCGGMWRESELGLKVDYSIFMKHSIGILNSSCYCINYSFVFFIVVLSQYI